MSLFLILKCTLQVSRVIEDKGDLDGRAFIKLHAWGLTKYDMRSEVCVGVFDKPVLYVHSYTRVMYLSFDNVIVHQDILRQMFKVCMTCWKIACNLQEVVC